jgi:diadenosine tetraphosphate (Ap4A) HIT family hydrolase
MQARGSGKSGKGKKLLEPDRMTWHESYCVTQFRRHAAARPAKLPPRSIRENPLSDFQADERLVRDSDLLTKIGLCELRLMKDGRWPWLVLVPQRPDVSEIFDLTPLDQTMLAFEMTLVSEALKKATGATKINTGALGNVVRQLHVHVIARSEGDPNWPGPVWGHGSAQPRSADETKIFAQKLLDALAP